MKAKEIGLDWESPIKREIWHYAQNKPELVVEDLKPFVLEEIVRESLLKRGINKWLANRALIIRLKHYWKLKINALELEKWKAKAHRDPKKYYELKGMVKALTSCRNEIRAICKGPRWIEWDKDRIKLVDYVGNQKKWAIRFKKLFEFLMSYNFENGKEAEESKNGK